jgi:NTP pyrophosphatase (non-canonical NTP hydrolase)
MFMKGFLLRNKVYALSYSFKKTFWTLLKGSKKERIPITSISVELPEKEKRAHEITMRDVIKLKIAEFQNLMQDLYLKRDKARGLEKTMLWLVSEVGELSEAIRLQNSQKIAEEAADVLAWLCSVANLTNIDLETAASSKYPGKCARCDSNPCKCKNA